jgi:hypothetical protein
MDVNKVEVEGFLNVLQVHTRVERVDMRSLCFSLDWLNDFQLALK